jgi:aminoglycoside phosphotransferase (APT) family kinase protein
MGATATTTAHSTNAARRDRRTEGTHRFFHGDSPVLKAGPVSSPPVSDPEGIDRAKVSAWLTENVEGLRAPFEFTLVAGGRSNLTFKVDDAAGRSVVLRRPPLSSVLATAHDVGREHKIISALGPTAVPVPDALGRCDDPEVNGSPFYVMSFVDGIIVRDATVGRDLTTPETRAVMGDSLVDVLADLHRIDPDDVGLGDLGRKEGYIERQLKRWSTQFDASTTRDLPVVKDVHRRLAEAVPVQGPAAIAHGDYRLDNCICDPDGHLAAVLDWELCTLGDALADLGMLVITWAQEGDTRTARPDAATQLPGFPSRDEVVARYAERTGRDVSDLPYYCAFQYWRLACISEGVYARYAAGAMGDQRDVDVEVLSQGTPRLAALAAQELDRR